jgi:hypothetical protein
LDKEFSGLLSIKYPALSFVFSNHWGDRLIDYSRRLYEIVPITAIDPLLMESFMEEWARINLPCAEIDQCSQQLKRIPIIQTAHHVTPTNGPTFLANDIIALAGKPHNSIYLVGVISGLPFSNSAISGSIIFDQHEIDQVVDINSAAYPEIKLADATRRRQQVPIRRISMISARMRGALVYSTKVDSLLLDKWSSLTDKCQKVLSEPKLGEPYSYWACRSSQSLERHILLDRRIIYFDLTRVVSRFIQKALHDEEHPISRILFDKSIVDRIVSGFENPTVFLEHDSRINQRVISICLGHPGSQFHHKQSLTKKAELMEKLVLEKACPSMFLVLFALKFLSGIRCLGSFLQIDELERQRRIWGELGLDFQIDLTCDLQKTLTTGRMIINHIPIYPLDLALNDKFIELNELNHEPMHLFWKPIAQQLAQSVIK